MHYKKNWEIAKSLCENNDHWEFKHYVLVLLFYRYISENLTRYINEGEREAGFLNFDYAELKDEEAKMAIEDITITKGYFLFPSQLFCNVLKKAPTDDNLNETIEKIFRSIEVSSQGCESEDDFRGLFDKFDVNSRDLGDNVSKRNERLIRLMNGVASMTYSMVPTPDIPSCGDVYEHLMGMFASEAGKKGGDSFTPLHISDLLIQLALGDKNQISKKSIIAVIIFDILSGITIGIVQIINKMKNKSNDDKEDIMKRKRVIDDDNLDII